MKAVANILKSKHDPTVYTIAPDASVFDALKLMAEKGIGALVVTKGEQVVGIITERDYARKVIARRDMSPTIEEARDLTDRIVREMQVRLLRAP